MRSGRRLNNPQTTVTDGGREERRTLVFCLDLAGTINRYEHWRRGIFGDIDVIM